MALHDCKIAVHFLSFCEQIPELMTFAIPPVAMTMVNHVQVKYFIRSFHLSTGEAICWPELARCSRCPSGEFIWLWLCSLSLATWLDEAKASSPASSFVEVVCDNDGALFRMSGKSRDMVASSYMYSSNGGGR